MTLFLRPLRPYRNQAWVRLCTSFGRCLSDLVQTLLAFGLMELLYSERRVKAYFHSVQNVARSIFCDRFNFFWNVCQSTTANEICSAWLFVFQKKAIAKSRLRNILHWMEIRLNTLSHPIHSLTIFLYSATVWCVYPARGNDCESVTSLLRSVRPSPSQARPRD
jgi:hypothetical protein